MKTYRIMLRGGDVINVKAEEQTMGDQDRILYFWQKDKVVAGFNLEEIVGFVQVDNIGV